jgi:gliding motility-associated-like protein
MRLLIITYFFMPLLTFSQMVTSTAQTPGGLVQNVLLGPGVTVSNITYTGSPSAIGDFTATGTNLALESGIVLTTGTVLNNGNGPHGPNNSSNSGVDNNRPGYFRLNNLLGGGATTFNAAVLEFDFIPYSDTVRFRYVFGSEEYMEYVNSAFNDVFAFFISGPGIPGGIMNMAKLPNGSEVAINNVNNGTNNAGPCANCALYNYNGDGTNAPFNSNPFYIQYDGFTKPIEAVAKVQCGQTYHLIIAIADVGDGIYDSGIFLEANSLSSKVPVSVEYAMSFDAFNDPTMMAEGCVSTTVTLTRNTDNLAVPLTIPISVSGTATMGLDYTPIPNAITFPPGQSTVSFTFDALQDGIAEGIETLRIVFDIPDPCGGDNPIEINLKINDVAPVTAIASDQFLICPGEPVEIIPVVSGGVGPYVYQWNTGETTSSIYVSPSQTTTYTFSVTDNCLQETAVATIVVTIPVYDPMSLVVTDDITEICPYVPTDLSVEAFGGAGNYTYQWSSPSANLGTGTMQNVVPSESTTYTILVKDQCGNEIQETINYTILSPPLILEMSPAQLVCPFDSAYISVTATGGYGQYYYNWVHDGSNQSFSWVNPEVTSNYTVIVSDECQTFSVQGTTSVQVVKPIADFQIVTNIMFEDLPITFQNLTSGGSTYTWEFGDGNSSTQVHPNNTYSEPGIYYVTLIATNEIGCKDTIVKPITIEEEYWVYVPNTFTPDNNRYNNTFSISTINVKWIDMKIYNRWGELLFSTNDPEFEWDGTYKNKDIHDGTYVWKLKYVTNTGIEHKLKGHITILR